MSEQNTPDFGDLKVVRGVSARPVPLASSNANVVPVSRDYIVQPEPAPAPKRSLARFWWLPLLLVLGIGATIWGRNYYQARYIGSDYWAQVPTDQNMTLVEQRDSAGAAVGGYQITYRLNAFNETGEQRVLEFDARGADANLMPQPGDFVWLSASSQLVVRQQVVPESEVPANVRTLIAAHHN